MKVQAMSIITVAWQLNTPSGRRVEQASRCTVGEGGLTLTTRTNNSSVGPLKEQGMLRRFVIGPMYFGDRVYPIRRWTGPSQTHSEKPPSNAARRPRAERYRKRLCTCSNLKVAPPVGLCEVARTQSLAHHCQEGLSHYFGLQITPLGGTFVVDVILCSVSQFRK